MNTAFDLELRRHCPSTRIVYDLFHVTSKSARDVIDSVRVYATNQMRHDRAARRVVNQSRWLLSRNRET